MFQSLAINFYPYILLVYGIFIEKFGLTIQTYNILFMHNHNME